TVGPANDAEGSTRSHRRGHQGRDGRRSAHQRTPYHDCPGSQSGRAGGVRQVDRRTARGPCEGGAGPWHHAELAPGSLLKRQVPVRRAHLHESGTPDGRKLGFSAISDPRRSPPATQRTNIRNPGWSPTTVMCPLQGAVSSNRNTLPGRSRLVSPSVVVMEKLPCRTMPN